MRNLLCACLLFLAFVTHAEFTLRVDEQSQRYTVLDSDKPVLTYNYGSVSVPQGITGRYAVARSNYIHPLYGPNGEILTADYSKDHPHHRGIYWAWPAVSYKGEKRDLHALQGVFARPLRLLHQEATGAGAKLTAENVWKWNDTEEIVREEAAISVSPAHEGIRCIDFQFRLEALKPGVSLARRNQVAYGGMNCRFSAFTSQTITNHLGPSSSLPQETWAELAGIPPGGQEPIGLFLLQNPTNPLYPCDWVAYPDLNWLQPAFPKRGVVFELLPGQPLTLTYRLIIRSGEGLQKTSSTLFNNYVKENSRVLFEKIYHDTAIPSTQRGAALISMAKLNPQEVSQTVVEALTGKDAHLRHAATAALRTLDSSVLETLLKRFPTLPLESQWTLVPLWAEHRFTTAEPTIIGCLTSTDETLRLEAVRALRKLGSAVAIPSLLEAGTQGGPLAKEIEVTLQHMQGKDVTAVLQASSTQTNKPAQTTLAIKALGSRMDPGTCDFLLKIAATGTTKNAELALTTLKNQATAETLPRLRILLLEKPDLTDSLSQAIIAICKRQPDPAQALSTFLDTPIKAAIESQLRELQMKNVEK